MATSGTRLFNPDFAALLSEAFARCLIRPAVVNQEHIDEAMRSANLTFIKMAAISQQQFQMQEVTLSLVAGTPEYDLPVGALEAWSAVLRKDDQDTPVWPMSRVNYQRIPNKTNEGRPFNYLMERGKVGNDQRTVTLWPVPDTTGDELLVWCVMRPEDVTAMPETLGIAWEWFDAYAAELAQRIARKFAPELVADLKAESNEAVGLAKHSDRERAPLRLRMRGYTRGRRF
jgi:hypothetical protein